MKYGMRTPSFKKSLKARTTGKAQRMAKKAINPMYGKKGMGYINNPKKAVYNKVYNKTTVDTLKSLKKSSSNNLTLNSNDNEINKEIDESAVTLTSIIILIIIAIPIIISAWLVSFLYSLGS